MQENSLELPLEPNLLKPSRPKEWWWWDTAPSTPGLICCRHYLIHMSCRLPKPREEVLHRWIEDTFVCRHISIQTQRSNCKRTWPFKRLQRHTQLHSGTLCDPAAVQYLTKTNQGLVWLFDTGRFCIAGRCNMVLPSSPRTHMIELWI